MTGRWTHIWIQLARSTLGCTLRNTRTWHLVTEALMGRFLVFNLCGNINYSSVRHITKE